MNERVLFQVTVPLKWTLPIMPKDGEHVSGDLRTLYERATSGEHSTLSSGSGKFLEVHEHDLESGSASSTSSVVLRPAEMIREFLRNNGIFLHKEVKIKEIGRELPPPKLSVEHVKDVTALFREEAARESNAPPVLQEEDAAKVDATEEKVPVATESKGEVQALQAEAKAQESLDEESYSLLFSFTTESGFAEELLSRLTTLGVGVETGFGSVEVVALQFYRSRRVSVAPGELEAGPELTDAEKNYDLRLGMGVSKRAAKIRFNLREMRANIKNTVKSRIALDHVITLVNQSAELNFDYLFLCLIASLISLLGLAVNSVVVIVASMLISPLMGPIIGATFGFTIKDKEMFCKGLLSELIGLVICIVVGFIGGLPAAAYRVFVAGDVWPTEEMAIRGTADACVTGLFVAAFSGLGVGLSILGNNTSSLVGVAISASLLPPAVNTGMLLATMCLESVLEPPLREIFNQTRTLVIGCNGLPCTFEELYGHSAFSFLLVVVNVGAILLTASAVFKLKEVAPSKTDEDFWKIHVPLARNYNTIIDGNEPKAKKLLRKLREASRLGFGDRSPNTHQNRSPQASYTSSVGEKPQILHPGLFEAPQADELADLIHSEDPQGSFRIKGRNGGPHPMQVLRKRKSLGESQREEAHSLKEAMLKEELYLQTINGLENSKTISGVTAQKLRHELMKHTPLKRSATMTTE